LLKLGRPGKTQLINHFLINNNWFLVDLPGYGYAKGLKKPSPFFQQFITDYFETREQLVCAFVLIDIRHEAQAPRIHVVHGRKRNLFCIILPKRIKLAE
jgi:GTP-binding protein